MLKSIFTIIFILYSLVAFSTSRIPEKRNRISSDNYVLILSSYQYENLYGTAIAKKIQYYLEQENPELIFRTVYASLDIQQTMLSSRLNMQKAFTHARITPKVLLPRILVLIGDESWMLYRIMNLRGLWEKIPVVLCGVHDQILQDYTDFFTSHSLDANSFIPIKQSANQLSITGVLQDNVSYKMAAFIRQLLPSIKEIVYLSNGSYGDEYVWQENKTTLSKSLTGLKLTHFNTRLTSPDSLSKYINRLSPDSAAVLYNTRPSILSLLKLPIFSLRNDENDNPNVLGGYYTTVDQYARQTSKLVMRLYNGTPIYDLPFQYIQDHHFHLNIQTPHLTTTHWQEKNLPGLVYFNIPPPFFIRNFRTIIIILLFLSISITGIILLVRSKKYQKNIQTLLAKYKTLHDKFSVIYDHMPIALVIFDTKGNLLYQNAAVEKLEEICYNYSFKQVNLFNDLIVEPEIRAKIKQKENLNLILPISDGKYQKRISIANQENCHYFQLVIRYIPDETNNTDNILVILIDNTEIYQEKITHKKIRNVFNFAMNKASIGVAEYNLCTHEGMATDFWYKHLNLKNKKNPSDASIFQHITGQDRKEILYFLTQASRGEKKDFTKEIAVIHDDNSIHYLREQFKVIEYQPENKQIWITELNQNIDEEKKNVAEMYAAIEKAQEAERLKNTFIANMSHEIRSPLNAIVGFSNLMISTTDLELRQEMIHHIEESNETLLRLINDIIDLSKIETGSMTYSFSEIDLNALFWDITAIHQIKANQKKLTLECHCPRKELYILTDKIRIKQVISNFLSNAIKFTQEGSIHLGYRLEKGDELYIYVSDTGIGISKEHSSKIFDRFYRTNKTYNGYGLGLSIAQSVIEGLNGEIGVESKTGEGSTFWFRIPTKILKHIEITEKIISSNTSLARFAGGRCPHILIVEDDENNFLLLQFMLKDTFHITHAWNGKEAVKLFQEKAYDLILMDIKIPQKDGYQATQEIRALSPKVPVIATTAYAFSKSEIESTNNEFNAYLAKPLQRQTLLKTINDWLNYAN